MLLSQEKTSAGNFQIENNELSGVLVLSKGKPIEVTFTLNRELSDYASGMIRVPIVHGVLREGSEKVTIVDGNISQSHWSSNGVFEYKLRANVLVVGEFIENLEDFRIDNLNLICKQFSEFLGNNQVEAIYDYNTNIATLKIPFKKTISSFGANSKEISLDSFYNFEKHSLRSKFFVEQINAIVMGLSPHRRIYDAISCVRTVENFLSFILQTRCLIDEVVYFSLEKISNKEIPQHRHLYFFREPAEAKEVVESKVLLPSLDLSRNLGLYLQRWIDLTERCNYLDLFFPGFFSTLYIDQRIVAEINLIEALHRMYYGVKQPDTEITARLDRILPQILGEDDREFIRKLISSKNGFGLNSKIIQIVTKSGIKAFDKSQLADLQKIRTTSAHGDSRQSLSMERYLELHRILSEVVTAILRKEIFDGPNASD